MVKKDPDQQYPEEQQLNYCRYHNIRCPQANRKMKLYLFFALPLTVAFTVPNARTYTAPKSSSLLAAEPNGVNGSEKKKVIILGADGFCGWPTSLYLSDQGHDVVMVDNLSRRNIDTELGCDSLTPIQSPDVSTLLLCAEFLLRLDVPLSQTIIWFGVEVKVATIYN